MVGEFLAQFLALFLSMLGQERVVDALAMPGGIVVSFSVADEVEDRRHAKCPAALVCLALGC